MNYIEHLLILASTFTGCVSISDFASVVGILVGTTSSTVGLKACIITIRSNKCKSIIKKKRKKNHDEIVFLVKIRLNIIEVLISKALTNLNIIHDDFIWIDNMFKQYEETKSRLEILKKIFLMWLKSKKIICIFIALYV